MDALFGAIGLVGLAVTLLLFLLNKKKRSNYKKYFGIFGVCLVLWLALPSNYDPDKPTRAEIKKQEKQEEIAIMNNDYHFEMSKFNNMLSSYNKYIDEFNKALPDLQNGNVSNAEAYAFFERLSSNFDILYKKTSKLEKVNGMTKEQGKKFEEMKREFRDASFQWSDGLKGMMKTLDGVDNGLKSSSDFNTNISYARKSLDNALSIKNELDKEFGIVNNQE